MGLALLIVFMFVAYGLTTLCRRWIDIPTLIAVAIGCAVNANIFTPLNSGIVVGPFVFSIESILYTLFMYTIIVRILDYGYQEAKRMTFTSIAAIIISAFIELIAVLSINGANPESFKTFSYYIFSSIGTIAGVWLMILITIKCRSKNISSYIIVPIAIAASCLVHAAIYYGGYSLVQWKIGLYTLNMFLGTVIGKTICVALSILCYFINQKYWKPLSLVSKEKEEDNK